ncbi:hypothetical protein IQ241_24965 [Romeria aff. gracilis LEGE 07310]|uniref:Uncharacterized protein n=1 Tax=Vasconcelosia minhoensis LEGE 07310 TaxID=915328 RepID=A0A8J7AYY2_9CYAN|nr:hypothetical protein [Romeria gracilis]MBE9080493.1 hypothetical protein [Romeria aff. gracilis LEGE 07310]
MPHPDSWQPLPIQDIQPLLGSFHRWVLCGGRSIDWWINRSTRQHADTDIGVFRSDLSACLDEMDPSRIYLCDPPGQLKRWDGKAVPAQVHDIWVTDTTHDHWILQLMIYDDDSEQVIYRRDCRITWSKHQHALTVRNLRILNPVITLLFKLHRSQLEDKDCLDVLSIIDAVANSKL